MKQHVSIAIVAMMTMTTPAVAEGQMSDTDLEIILKAMLKDAFASTFEMAHLTEGVLRAGAMKGPCTAGREVDCEAWRTRITTIAANCTPQRCIPGSVMITAQCLHLHAGLAERMDCARPLAALDDDR